MSKVGQFVVDPGAGAYCKITLDSGERVMVSHPKGGFKGGPLSVVALKWLGWAEGEKLFDCDLDGARGRAILARLTAGAREGSVEATPLGAFVGLVKDCPSVAELRRRLGALGAAP
jgi:hypothetical protein